MKKKLTIAFAAAVVFLTGVLGTGFAAENPLAPGSELWYVPANERYGRTEFYVRQDMHGPQVRVNRPQRFKVLAVRRGWVLVEFEVAGKAFALLRMLNLALYNPSADDPWYEFKRASVFPEDPAKIEARLKGPQEKTPAVVDSKTPAWKRYKDAWGLKPSRSPAAASTDEPTSSQGTQPAPRPIAGSAAAKPRSKYPLLTPLGSEPPRETTAPEAPERDAEAAPPR